MRRLGQRLLILASALILGSPALAREGNLPDGVRVKAAVKGEAQPGQAAKFSISIVLDKGWITYDVEQAEGSAMPTKVNFENSSTFIPIESLTGPPASDKFDPAHDNRMVRYFETSPKFERDLLVSPFATPGTWGVVGTIDFEVCNTATGRCYIVRNHPFQTTLRVVPKTSSQLDAIKKTEAVPNQASAKIGKAAGPALHLPNGDTAETNAEPPKVPSRPIENSAGIGKTSPAPAPVKESVITPPTAPVLPLPKTTDAGSVKGPANLGAAPAKEPKTENARPSSAALQALQLPSQNPTPQNLPANASAAKNSTAKTLKGAEPASKPDISFDPGGSSLQFTSNSGDLWQQFLHQANIALSSMELWWPILLSFILGLVADFTSRNSGATAKSRCAGAVAAMFIGVGAVGLALFLDLVIYQWTLIGIGVLLTVWMLWRSAEQVELLTDEMIFGGVSELRSPSAWPTHISLILFAYLGAMTERTTVHPLFPIGAFFVGHVAAELLGGLKQLVTIGKSTPVKKWNHPAFVSVPSVTDFVFGLAAIAFTVGLFIKMDPFEGSVAWLQPRFALGIWAGCGAIATVRLFLPWPEAARGVFLRGVRLLMTCFLALFTVAMAYRCFLAE